MKYTDLQLLSGVTVWARSGDHVQHNIMVQSPATGYCPRLDYPFKMTLQSVWILLYHNTISIYLVNHGLDTNLKWFLQGFSLHIHSDVHVRGNSARVHAYVNIEADLQNGGVATVAMATPTEYGEYTMSVILARPLIGTRYILASYTGS